MTATFQIAQTLQGRGQVRRRHRRLSGLSGQVSQRPAVGRRPASHPRHPAPDRRECGRAREVCRRPRRLAGLRRPEPARRPGPPGALRGRREFREGEEVRRGDRRLGALDRQVPRHRAGLARPVRDRLDLRGREEGDILARQPSRSSARSPPIPGSRRPTSEIGRDGVEGAHRRHPPGLPVGRDGPPESHDAEPREPHVHGLQVERARPTSRKKRPGRRSRSSTSGLVAPDAEWTAEVKGYGKFKPVETTYDLKIKTPGVFVVKVTDEKSLQATAPGRRQRPPLTPSSRSPASNSSSSPRT